MHTSTYLKALQRLGGTPEKPVMPESLTTFCTRCGERFMLHPKKHSDICGWCKVKKEAFSNLMAE